MIPVECPNCKSQLKAPDEAAGRTAKCKKCGSSVKIPSPTTVAKPADKVMIATRNVEIAVLPPNPPSRANAITVPAQPQMTACPFCGEDVLLNAKKCKHCGEILDVALRAAEESKRMAESASRAQSFMPAASSSSSSTVVVLNHRTFPHTMHLILTILTCGFWLPIWLIHYLISPK